MVHDTSVSFRSLARREKQRDASMTIPPPLLLLVYPKFVIGAEQSGTVGDRWYSSIKEVFLAWEE